TYSAASKAGVDIVDVAMSAMSGNTSQPSMSSLYYALVNGPRLPEITIENAQKLNHYWEDVRMYYKPFENGLNAPETEVYMHEMPGGQYSNLQQQAKAVGLGHRWDEIKQMYHTVNLMFGDIVKVTPSSKVVGDMALFMVQNDLTEEDIYEKGETLSFPESVVTFFQGELGQPVGGFPKKLQKIILKGRPALNERPGLLAESVDFNEVKKELAEKIGYEPKQDEVLSYLMYPQVFLDYQKAYNQFGDVTLLDTPTFFQGIRLGETINVQIERGKTLIIRLDEIGEPDIEGNRVLFFNLNGQRREITIKDNSIISTVQTRLKAEPTNREQIGATMSGSVLDVLVKKGDNVKKGDTLMITEAMKMETAIEARFDGEVAHVYVSSGDTISSGDLLIEVTEK
ncbi:pyruvate carboxylase, partial [Enterococcus faecium MRSN 4777]